ncbi:ribosome silencing factor [Ammoniphilus sp. CFH 90114]|uniref:ribosome silencing factor n=1 Tax=Ammoniphilus sp. CFH 90114 TaxID=2493665 RepID=UPI00100F7AF5|nr:ribosome silencing factor [Ammoniphilus sp. CFH 90114]RXT14791.1 ribosome silencing factor [Ammoniphilus sp. CFH 90114]
MTVLEIAKKSAEIVEDKKAGNVLILDIQGLSVIADYFVICHGNSSTQVQALTSELKKRMNELGIEIKGVEGYDDARWVLVDLGDVVVHIFHKDEREYYNIERIWGDAGIVGVH